MSLQLHGRPLSTLMGREALGWFLAAFGAGLAQGSAMDFPRGAAHEVQCPEPAAVRPFLARKLDTALAEEQHCGC